MTIYIDSREHSQHPEFYNMLSKEHEVVVQMLPSADFVITGMYKTCVIERKHVLDFIASLQGKRLFNELITMKSYEGDVDCRLVLEGWIGLIRKRRWNEKSIYAEFDAVVAKEKWNVPIIPTPDVRGTATYISWKQSQLGHPPTKKKYALRIGAKRQMTLKEKALCILQGFSGISVVHSENILRHFGSLRKFFANAEHVDDVPKIGPKLKEEILKVINYEWED